ncbi:MAG: response regulator [Pseudomonadota bacterium]
MDTNSHWVAVVDDEEPIRRALIRLLKSAGIKGKPFASGPEFLASLAASKPYCVILDLHMSGMSGFEVQAELAHVAPDIGVIVATGHHSQDVQARVLRLHPVAYLLKPMNDQLLLDAIRVAWDTRFKED